MWQVFFVYLIQAVTSLPSHVINFDIRTRKKEEKFLQRDLKSQLENMWQCDGLLAWLACKLPFCTAETKEQAITTSGNSLVWCSSSSFSWNVNNRLTHLWVWSPSMHEEHTIKWVIAALFLGVFSMPVFAGWCLSHGTIQSVPLFLFVTKPQL